MKRGRKQPRYGSVKKRAVRPPRGWKPKKLQPNPEPAPVDHYRVEPGTAGLVRKAGETAWTPYTTTRQLTFAPAQLVAVSGRLVFVSGGWSLSVPSRDCTAVLKAKNG